LTKQSALVHGEFEKSEAGRALSPPASPGGSNRQLSGVEFRERGSRFRFRRQAAVTLNPSLPLLDSLQQRRFVV